MAMLVRTWNVYHGRTHPQSRDLYLRQMIELVTQEGPDVVALQEVPVWALGALERWTGMTVRWAITVSPLLLAPLARLVTELRPRSLRGLVTGQANALLLAARYRVGEQRLLLLNPGVTKWDWLFKRGPQQRYLQTVRVAADGRDLVVANLHATNRPIHAAQEVQRAADFVAEAERCILCGDFNVPRFVVPEFSPPIDGIDQILVRGLEFERGPEAWQPERRRIDGRLLSDHAPVEAVVR